ncbi:MAG: hypothetical protein QNJ70_22745 [Xenococcaceae cyanobacterium MO_207.B15]|nr:hypothetical protein [Xenococcaceae cyanobacterium MO_207.B15]
MPEPLDSKEEQIQVIEANADRIIAVAKKGYSDFKEKGTVVILRQLENNTTVLEDWQIVFKPIVLLPNVVSDWKESGLQDLIIKYNPETSVICTFLYPDGAHTSYHFSAD